RLGALVVVVSVATTWIQVRLRGVHGDLASASTLLLVLIAVQFSLGAATVLSGRDVWINSLHVVCGALVLATSLTVTVKSWRSAFRDRGLRVGNSTGGWECSRLEADQGARW